MPKVKPLTDVENIPAFIQQVNSNFDKIEEAFDNTVSRDGSTPNEMNAVLDMNGQNIINIGGVSFVDGPAVLTDAENVLFDTPVGWIADNVQDGIEEAYQKASDETTLVENSVTTLSENAVRVDVAQSHSPSEQTQGRDNLGLGDLAVKDSVDVADINATGTANATTRLAGDGTWQPVSSWERIASVATAGSGAVLVTGLDAAKSYRISMPRGRASTTVSVRVRFSNDGGSTFGPYVTLINSANWNTSMFFSAIELTPTSVGVAWQLLSFSSSAAGFERIYPCGIHYEPGTSTLLCPVDYDSVEFSTSSGTFVDPAAGPANVIEVFERA